jgi:hypothetical protein
MARLAEREFGAPISSWELAGWLNHLAEERGHFFTPIFRVKLGAEPTKGQWWPVTNLGVIAKTGAFFGLFRQYFINHFML